MERDAHLIYAVCLLENKEKLRLTLKNAYFKTSQTNKKEFNSLVRWQDKVEQIFLQAVALVLVV